ncbi:MAG TPA: hypothetical protein VKR06_07915 [Ktedonosporobacter sp.]|nr:hypothetical protein [Ktedonosporobacter sp.]
MPQRLTSLRNPNYPRHFCPECADGRTEATAELALAYEAGSLEITNEVEEEEQCSVCLRPIADVPADERSYQIELQLTFSCTVELNAKSATSAEYTLASALDAISFDKAQDGLERTLSEQLHETEQIEIESISVDDCEHEVGEARSIPPFVSPTQERFVEHLRNFWGK